MAEQAVGAGSAGGSILGLQLAGVGLFLFIPLVLFLLVVHPEPIGLSLLAAVALIPAHRLVARPYMRAAAARKCLWCNRVLPPSAEPLALGSGSDVVVARTCPAHAAPARRFLAFVDRRRLLLRAGIFLPLLLLLCSLAAAAAGYPLLPWAVPVFQLVIGITVNVAAIGYLTAPTPAPASRPEATPLPVPFPVHNFFLLGIGNLLWVFRLIGLWWIARGAFALLALR